MEKGTTKIKKEAQRRERNTERRAATRSEMLEKCRSNNGEKIE